MMQQLPFAAKYISDILAARGVVSYAVGGWVRDVCLGRAPHDCDLACALTPEEIMAIFAPLPDCHVVPTGVRYGTVTIFVQANYAHGVEVTTFRADSDYSDGRRPDSVSFSTCIGEDLARRDFTVNALALDTVTGAVIDVFAGRDDLREKLIRCVGDPAVRFREDALRMLRAVRFAATLDFTIEASTLAAIADLAPLLANVSRERVRDELGKMLLSARPAYALELLRQLGTLPYLVPEMLPLIGFEQNNPNHTMDVWHHTLTVVENVPAELTMRTTALLHDLAKPECYSVGEDDGIGHFYGHEAAGARIADVVLQRLRYPTEQRQEIVRLIANHRINFASDWTDAAWRRLINKHGCEVVAQLITFRHADQSGKGTRTQADCAAETAALRRRLADICTATPPESLKLAITGADIMRILHLPPGPRIGQILATLQEQVLDDPAVNTREELLRVLGGWGIE